jgi:hypothetical protein
MRLQGARAERRYVGGPWKHMSNLGLQLWSGHITPLQQKQDSPV